MNTEVVKPKAVLTIIGYIIFIIAFFLTLNRVDKFLKLKAFADCAVSSRYEKDSTQDQTKVYYPVPDVYSQCLQAKGY